MFFNIYLPEYAFHPLRRYMPSACAGANHSHNKSYFIPRPHPVNQSGSFSRYYTKIIHMKKILFLILTLLLPAMSTFAKKEGASIRFSEQTYNFGTIPENGGKVTHSFEFINDGASNLVIVDAKADCGCTLPEFPAKPIAPGKKGVIKITFDPKYRPGQFNKVVTVRTNGKQKKVRLKISGTVNPNK